MNLRNSALLCFFVLAACMFAAAGTAPSHCSADEKVIFSCKIAKAKVISLCASATLDGTSGYLQYRFGPLGQPAELVYPATKDHPKTHFKSGTLSYSGGGGAYLEFFNNDFEYVVYTGVGRGWEKEGLDVLKAGKQVSNLRCVTEPVSELGPDFFDKAAIPAADDEFEIP